ncbi:DUF1801 domain-containing protein [Acidaminobacter sp. JC074]|uniref:DUF1801 domain-containing protein n=1 Tax=Acidaminobacter sp. JC074 TaxID=2530199 RepID=UPI001F1117F8|nr:DUF1801 domain-containing protein [Acidaminobacter sp. JC074]MCH4889938.1 DUF1801 domain-containing protein [Acidaminobacter sp. JC074]
MYELKTKINDKNVLEFLNNVDNKRRKEDSLVVLEIMSRLTKEEAKMWGDSIIGFGTYKYSNSTGKEFEWMKIGFSPRKQSLTLYIMNGYDHYEDLLKRLGKHKLGKSCLYINKLDDIDLSVLEELISHSFEYVTKNY